MISLNTYTGETLTATQHAMMNYGVFPYNGVLNSSYSLVVTGNTIHFNDDIYGFLAGRLWNVNDETLTVVLPTSGTLVGQVYLQLETANPDNPLRLMIETASSASGLTPMYDGDYGENNFEDNLIIRWRWLSFDVTPTEITNVSGYDETIIGWGKTIIDNLKGVVPVSKGGTNATTLPAARQSLFGSNLASTATHLLAITADFAAGGYIGIENAKTLLGIYDSGASRTANTVLAAPNGSNGAAVFRKLVADDIPNLPASKVNSGTFDAARIPNLSTDKLTSGTLPIARGGTGGTTAATAREALGAAATNAGANGRVTNNVDGGTHHLFSVRAVASQYSSDYEGKEVSLLVNDNGFTVWNHTDNVAIMSFQIPLQISRGGTGATTVAGARNALGLGNTSGALPIANGGTGETTAAAARKALGAAQTTEEAMGAITPSSSSGQAFFVASNAGTGSTHAGDRLLLVVGDTNLSLYDQASGVGNLWTINMSTLNTRISDLQAGAKDPIRYVNATATNQTIPANSTATVNVTLPTAPTGFTYAGIMSVTFDTTNTTSGASPQNCFAYNFYISNGRAYAQVRNVGSSAAKVSVHWHILYTRNAL